MEEQERPEETEDVEGHKHHDPSVGGRVAATDDDDDVEAHKHHAPKAGAPQVGATDDDDDDVEAHGRVPGHVPSPKAG